MVQEFRVKQDLYKQWRPFIVLHSEGNYKRLFWLNNSLTNKEAGGRFKKKQVSCTSHGVCAGWSEFSSFGHYTQTGTRKECIKRPSPVGSLDKYHSKYFKGAVNITWCAIAKLINI